MNTYKTKLLALSMAAAMALTLTGCGSKSEASSSSSSEGTSQGVAVQVEEIQLSDISTDNSVSGQVASDDERSIFIAASVKCTKTYFEAGDRVNAGDIICTLDLASTQASYEAATISYNSAAQSYRDQSEVFAQQISLYQKNLADLKQLYEIGAASQIEIDQAQLQLDSAIATRNATLAQLEAGMQSYRSNIEQLSTVLENVDGSGNVIAPITGTLVNMNAVENSFISNTMPVAVIDGADQMKVRVSVSETLVPKLSIGDEADITVSSIGQTFTGTIRSVEQAASQQTKLYTVTLAVPSDVSGLLSGMFADVTFHTDTSKNTIVIPTETIMTSGNSQYVYIVENSDTAKYVEVTTGLTGTGVTEITSGLEAGQQLVVVGQTYLSDGDAVRVVSGED